MNGKRIGQQTIELPSRPALCGSAAFVGRKEGEGPLGHCFDHVAKDEMYGQESFELAERQLYLESYDETVLQNAIDEMIERKEKFFIENGI